MRFHSRAPAFVVVLAACGGVAVGPVDAGSDGSSGSSGSGSTSGSSSGVRVPVNHRPDDSQCSTPRSPGDCGPGGSSSSSGAPPGQCSADSDCTAGQDGRCVNAIDLPLCTCSYDACVHDSDCGPGRTCACHGSDYGGVQGNACVTGDCRVDADCGAGGYCSPTLDMSQCGTLGGFYCHTPADQCIDDADCTSTSGTPFCVWSPGTKRWECTSLPPCGGAG
jgi:hypothetical protein